MSLWSDRYASSGLWPEVEAARALVNRLDVPTDDGPSQSALVYVGMCIELLERRRTETDAHEVTPSMLERARSAVVTWKGALENVVAGDWPLSDAVEETDAVLDALAAWPPLKPARYLSGIQAATDSFVGKMQEALRTIDTEASSSEERLRALTEAEAALGEKIDAEKQRISEAIATFQTDSTARVADVVDETRESLDELLAEFNEKATTYLTSLEGHEAAARDTVHATTALVVATDYGAYARNKTIAGWVCDVAAAVVGAAGVGVILWHLISLDGTADGNVGLSITRLAASLGTLGIAALIARRGAQHHKEARAAKRTDLAIRRVMPFIANLPKDEQEEIVLDFTERVFIRGDLDSAALETTSTLRERIAEIRKARRERLAAENDPDTP